MTWNYNYHLYCSTCQTAFSFVNDGLYEKVRKSNICPVCHWPLETKSKKSDWNEE